MVVSTSWIKFLLPIFIALSASYLLIKHDDIVAVDSGFFAILTYFFYSISLVLAAMFKRGHIAMLIITNIIAYIIIQTQLQTPLSEEITFITYCLLAFLFPVSLYSIYFFKNSSFFTKRTFYYLLSIVFLISWSMMILSYYKDIAPNDTINTLLYTYPSISRLPILLLLYLLAINGISAIVLLNNNKLLSSGLYTSLIFFSTTIALFNVKNISSTSFLLNSLFQIIHIILYVRTMAYKDKLTGLYTRRVLDVDLLSLKKRYSVAMIDVDHFKKFNDTYGHSSGDDVLRLVGSRLKELGRKAKVYRYGGEEFTVVYKNMSADEAKIHLDELRESLSNYEMIIRNTETRSNNKLGVLKRKNRPIYQTVKITVSIGISEHYAKDSKVTANDILNLADEALYQAKEQGRNRVVIG